MTLNSRSIKDGCFSCFRLLVKNPFRALSVFVVLLFGGSLLWAKTRDPFERMWFTDRKSVV